MNSGAAPRLIVAVPVKDLTHAKQRLTSVLTADERGQIIEGVREGAPVFVPSRSGLGTNGVALAPPDAMPLTFGEPSFARHLAAARRHGLAPRVLSLPGLGLDVDAPEDLTALLAERSATETRRLVSSWRERGGRHP